jgi:hypothetical protein
MQNNNFARFFQKELRRDEQSARFAFIITGILLAFIIADVIYLNLLILKNKPQTNHSIAIVASPSPTQIVSISPTSLTSPTSSVALPSFNPTVKEYFIPLGSGTNQSSDWTDVPGAQAVVDFGQYPDIKQVQFEASVYVPTANEQVFVRLYNQTDKHPVWYSDVVMNGNQSAYLTSQPLIVDQGEKLYQVQMKTQLQYPANLTQARIHVILK